MFLPKHRHFGDCLSERLTSAPSSQFKKIVSPCEFIVHYARPLGAHRAGCVQNDFHNNNKQLFLNDIFHNKSWHAGCNDLINAGHLWKEAP
jgi:hypothetical protein